MSNFVLYVDGGARGNPGPAAAGVVLQDAQGRSLLEAGYLLGELTNNQAEYSALLLGLQAAVRHRVERLTILSDSELMVKQLLGQYRVASAGLKKLFEDAQHQLLKINSWNIKHVNREENRRADQLVNQALDTDEDVIDVEIIDAAIQRLTTRSQPQTLPLDLDTSRAHSMQTVRVQVEIAPLSNVCPAPCKKGAEFIFKGTVPGGMCCAAARAVLEKILAIRNDPTIRQPLTVLCSQAGCRAAFKIFPQPQ